MLVFLGVSVRTGADLGELAARSWASCPLCASLWQQCFAWNGPLMEISWRHSNAIERRWPAVCRGVDGVEIGVFVHPWWRGELGLCLRFSTPSVRLGDLSTPWKAPRREEVTAAAVFHVQRLARSGAAATRTRSSCYPVRHVMALGPGTPAPAVGEESGVVGMFHGVGTASVNSHFRWLASRALAV